MEAQAKRDEWKKNQPVRNVVLFASSAYMDDSQLAEAVKAVGDDDKVRSYYTNLGKCKNLHVHKRKMRCAYPKKKYVYNFPVVYEHTHNTQLELKTILYFFCRQYFSVF